MTDSEPTCYFCLPRHHYLASHTVEQATNVTGPSTNVTRGFGTGAGRPRQYANATERQQAYRRRARLS